MNRQDFEEVFKHVTQQAEGVLLTKSKEYADDTDRLHNFKVAAGMIQGTNEQALWGMLVKHLTSLSDMVKNEKKYDRTIWDEKIGDAINYLILLRALVFERELEESA